MGAQNASYSGKASFTKYLGGIKKNSYTQYQKKYKFKPTQAISSSRGESTMKPPLGTINSTLPGGGITTYKYSSRSRTDQINQNQDNNSLTSFMSSGEPDHEVLRLSTGADKTMLKSGKLNNSNIDSNIILGSTKNYSNEIKRDVASKLSATLPKSSVYRKVGNDSSFKESPIQKTGIAHKMATYTNNMHDYGKKNALL